MSDLRAVPRTRDVPRRRWRKVAWWRVVASAYVVVAAVGAVEILAYSVAYWQPCFAQGYDSAVCNDLQNHDSVGAFVYDRIAVYWLVAAVGAVVTAVCAWRAAPRELVLGISLPVLLVNPLGDFFITPMVNGFYASYDAHPASGIPMGIAVAVSAVLAGIVALRPRRDSPTTAVR